MKKLIFFIPVVLWMVIVFKFSNEPADTSQLTSLNITKKIVKIISKNEITDEKDELVQRVDKIVRKTAHYTLYAIGGFLIMIYIYQYKITENKKILYSILTGSIYACTDEIHQVFIPGRTGEITDVCLDSLGVATGVCVCLLAIKIIRDIKLKINLKEKQN